MFWHLAFHFKKKYIIVGVQFVVGRNMCAHVWIFFLQNWGSNPSPNLLSDILNLMAELPESAPHPQ